MMIQRLNEESGTRHYSLKYCLQRAYYFVDFKKNNKPSNLKNASDQSSNCTDNCYMIKIKNLKTIIYNFTKKKNK